MNTEEEKLTKLLSIIKKTKDLRFVPSVYIYTIKQLEDRGLRAADIDEHNSNFAYSPGHSRDIYIVKQNDCNNIFNKVFSDERLEITDECLDKRKTFNYKHSADVTGLRFTADSNLLMSCCLDGSVKALNVDTLRCVESYNGNLGVCHDIESSSDCSYFASAFSHPRGVFPHAVNLYKFEHKNPETIFRGHKDIIDCVRFHSNARYLATASRDKTIKLWCTKSFKDVRCFRSQDAGHPKKMVFSPDGNYLAVAYTDSIKLWDLQASKVLKSFKLPNSKNSVLNLCLDKSGKILAVGGSDNMLLIWDIKDCSKGSEEQLLKCYNLDKRVYCIKYNTCFFSCILG